MSPWHRPPAMSVNDLIPFFFHLILERTARLTKSKKAPRGGKTQILTWWTEGVFLLYGYLLEKL